MKQNGFTLIELLVVVAIIGILAAVGIVAFNGFLTSSKTNATRTNHKATVNYMQAEFTKCSLGENKLTYDKWIWNGSTWNLGKVSEQCNSSAQTHAELMDDHLEANGFMNPFDLDARAVQALNGSQEPSGVGFIHIYCPTSNQCQVITKVSNSENLLDIVTRE